MKKSQADRNRAYRLRKKAAKSTATIEELSWLEDYKRTRKPRAAPPRRETAKPPAKPEATPSTMAQDQPRADPPKPARDGAAPFSSAPAGEARARVQSGFTPITFAGGPGGTPAASTSTGFGFSSPPMGTPPAAPTCNIPDCPACQSQTGLVCEVTGKRVFPPMTIQAATGLAEGIMFIVGLIARIVRKDKHHVEPTKHEIDCLAMGIREVQMRRANWLSAGSDFVMVWMGLGSYGKRAFTEKPAKKPAVAEKVAA